MRKRLLDDVNTLGGINAAWELSQAMATEPKREQGGLFGKIDATGNTVDSRFPRQASEQGSLRGFGVWAQRQMRQNRGIATYEFWYHTHPHNAGEMVAGEGMAINPEFPTGTNGDIGVSRDTGLLGILITKKRLKVSNVRQSNDAGPAIQSAFAVDSIFRR